MALSQAVQVLKHDKRIFEYTLQRNNVTASETIMIGDSFEADMVDARNAGIDQIYFNPNLKSNDTKPATFKIKSLAEIFDIL